MHKLNSKDKNDCEVNIGDHIKVLAIDSRILMHLPSDEKEELNSFINNILQVQSINSDGSMVVCKTWENPEQHETMGHEVAIFSNDALLVNG